MANRICLLYVQLLALLLITNQTFAFHKGGQVSIDVDSGYDSNSGLHDEFRPLNSVKRITGTPVNAQTIFNALDAIFSLTYQVLNEVNRTNHHLAVIEEIIRQKPYGEPEWAIESNLSDDVEEYWIWLRQMLSDLSSSKNNLKKHLDQLLTKPLSEMQSPALNPSLRLPPSRFKQRTNDQKRKNNDLRQSLDKIGKLSQRQPPSAPDLPLPTPLPLPPPDYSKRQLQDESYGSDIQHRSWEHPWRKELTTV